MSPRPSVSLRPLSLAIALALFAPLASAAEHYQLESGPLATQLNRFAAQAGIFLAGDASLTSGQHSRALDGSYSTEQALAILLEGSGLEAVKTGENRYELKPLPTSNGLELSALSISGKAPGSVTEGTGSYTTGSTSSSTRLNLSQQETPQSVTVMTRQRMEDQKLDTLADALDAAVGVIVKPLSPGGDVPQIFARGSIINNFQVDGIPVGASLGNSLQGTAAYDRVEIVRGATGIMSGLGNPSATVNMIRKRPTFESQVSLNAEAGNWDRYGAGFDISGPLTEGGSIRGRLVTQSKHQHGWTENYEQEYQNIYGIIEADLGENTLLALGFNHLTRNTDSYVAVFPMVYSNGDKIDFNASDNSTPDWAYYDNKANNIFVSIEHTFDSGWSLKSEANHTQYKYEALNASVTGSVNKTTGSGASALLSHWGSDINQYSLDTYLTGSFSFFGREHELIAGTTLSQQESASPSQTRTSANYSIPDIFSWTDDIPKPSYRKTGKSDGNEYQHSAYLSSRFHLTSGTSLLIGSRITDWKRTSDAFTYATGARSKTQNRESGIFTPYVGVVQSLDETWSLYASYTKIFQPQIAFISQYIDSPQPEEGTSLEAGIKASFKDGRVNSSLSLFETNQNNLAVWSNTILGYEMFNDTTTKGVELELSGELTENWNVSSGYAYSVTRNDENERIITRAPRHNLKVFTTYRLPNDLDKFTVGGGANWESKSGDNLQVIKQGSYALFNVMGRYDINENLSASININNLFDKEYTFAGVRGTYGAPRNFMTSLKYTY